MENQEQIKDMVRRKYSHIALQDKETNESSCCGSGCCSTEVYNIMADDYTTVAGYNPDSRFRAWLRACPHNMHKLNKVMW